MCPVANSARAYCPGSSPAASGKASRTRVVCVRVSATGSTVTPFAMNMRPSVGISTFTGSVELRRSEHGLRQGGCDAQLARIEHGEKRPSGCGHVAHFDLGRGDHTGIGRGDRGEALRCRGLAGIRDCRRGLFLRGEIFGLGLIERGLADEFLRKELPAALVLRFHVGEVGPGLAHLALACRLGLHRASRVDLREHLSRPHAVAGPDVERNDTTRDLRRERGLAHRLDHALGGRHPVEVPVLDERGLRHRRPVRVGQRWRKGGRGGQRRQ